MRALSVPGLECEIPAVTKINYASGHLTVTVQFADGVVASVEFQRIRGFRVLDEGDLLEFWDPEIRPDGWLWSVTDGGWNALESLRSGYVTGLGSGPSEYMLAGQDECVSVLSDAMPRVQRDSNE